MSLREGPRALLLDDVPLERLSDIVTVIDADGRVIATTAELRDHLGYEPSSWVGRDLFELLHPDVLLHSGGTLGALATEPGARRAGEVRLRHADGHWETVEFEAVNRFDSPVSGIVVTSRVVSAERRRERLRVAESEILELIGNGEPVATTFYAIARMVEEHSDDGHTAVLLLDEHDILRAGAAPSIPRRLFDALDGIRIDPDMGAFGRAVHERNEHRVADVDLHDELPNTDLERLRDVFRECGLRGYWSVPIIYADRTHGLGSLVTFYPHSRGPAPHERDVAETASRLAGIAIERDRLERRIHQLSERDALTGLPNRDTITRHLERLVQRPRPTGRTVAVMFIDVDAFNLVNDSHGHAAGDALLWLFASRVDDLLPAHTTFARFGGDEFVVLVDHADGDEEARRLAAQIEEALQQPFQLNGDDVFLTASIGVATPAPGSDSASAILGNADTALYQAKRSGRGGFVVFETGMRAEVVERLHHESSLRHAIDRNEFTLRYQPKVDLATGEVIGAEALLRWNHPTDGLVGPDDVIPWAESTGLIVPLGAWVLETAVRQARAWADSALGGREFLLAVNVSGRQLSSPGFPQFVADVIERHGWPAASVSLEITESVMISDTETSLDALRRIKELGVLLAVDDFGTGYSSLSYLHRFPIDIVKVDKGFVADLAHPAGHSPVATAVVAMANALGLTTSAEGIETPLQLDAVRRLGCQWAQGFLFAEALPPSELTDLLLRQPRW
jgi:diguanylate cyclase (GGDEF)-like protein